MSVSTDAAVRLAELVRGADSVVALTGAGISVPSGIPDFRSPGTGLWEKVNPMEVAHIDAFHRDPQRFWSFYGERFQTLEDKRPNRAHEVLAELERAGLLDAVITQNVDRLHARAGSVELIEVHGSISHSVCLDCSARFEIAEVRARHARDPERTPRCDCGTPLKPDVVLFGEYLPAGGARAGPAPRRVRRLAAVHRLLARGLSGRPAAGDDALRRRQAGDHHPGRDAVRPARDGPNGRGRGR